MSCEMANAALLALLQRQRHAVGTLREVGCRVLVSRQEPLRLGEVTLHAFHLGPALQ